MWLINARSYSLASFSESDAVREGYAILSHTWAEDELIFSDVYNLRKSKYLKRAQTKKGWTKLQYLCKQALEDGINYAWLDTCCIDKTSSAELSEAINSMYRWYGQAKICYVFLPDVTSSSFEGLDLKDEKQVLQSEFGRSRWFTRGWTLQELIAPQKVEFFVHEWSFVGDRSQLGDALSSITTIPIGQFGARRYQACVARKLSWAAKRETTRPEDLAYCLLGLFDINMPLLYGEGGRKAFERLQLEILQRTHDLSILLHKRDRSFGLYRLFAEVPAAFAPCGSIVKHHDFGLLGRSTVLEIMPGPHIALKLRLLTYLKVRPKRSLASVGFVDNGDLSGPIALDLCNIIEGDSMSSAEDTGLLECNSQGFLIAKPSEFVESEWKTMILTSEPLDQRSWIRDLFIAAKHKDIDLVNITLDHWCASNFQNIKLHHNPNVASLGSGIAGKHIGRSIRFKFIRDEVICLTFRHGNICTAFFLKCHQHEGMHPSVLYQIQQGVDEENAHILKDETGELWKWHISRPGDAQFISAGIIVELDGGEKLRAYCDSGTSDMSPPHWQLSRVPPHEFEADKKRYDEWKARRR